MQLNKSLLQKIIEIFVYLGCRTSNFTTVTVLKLLKVNNQMYILQWLLRPVSNSSPYPGTQGAQRNANLTGFQTSKDQLLAIKMACPALFFCSIRISEMKYFFPISLLNCSTITQRWVMAKYRMLKNCLILYPYFLVCTNKAVNSIWNYLGKG